MRSLLLAHNLQPLEATCQARRKFASDLKSLPGSSKDGAAKLFLMRDYDNVGRGLDVPDPYYGGDEGFQHVFDLLDVATDVIIEKYVKG